MNSSIVRLFLAAGLAATLAACGGGNSTSTTTDTTTTTDSNAAMTTDANNAAMASPGAMAGDASATYQKYFAGEDNQFGDLKAAQKSDDKDQTIMTVNAALPGKSDCTVIMNKDTKATLANCEYAFKTKAEADAMMATLKSQAMAAESGLTEQTMKLEKGNMTQFYGKNDKHAFETYTSKGAGGKFVAGIYFASQDDFKKTWGDNT